MSAPTYTVSLYCNAGPFDVRSRSGIKDLDAAIRLAEGSVNAQLFVYEAAEASVSIHDGTLRTGRTLCTFRKAAGSALVDRVEG